MALFKRRKKEEEQDSQSQEQQSQKTQTDKQKGGKTSMKDLYKQDTGGKKKESSQTSSSAQSKEKQKEEEKKQKASAGEKAVKKHGIAYRILVKPIITEKSGDLGVHNKYVFEVAINANKIDVAKSIEEVYGVMPRKVNIIKKQGKRVRFGRLHGKRKDTKKAIVTLPQGKTINVYEGV